MIPLRSVAKVFALAFSLTLPAFAAQPVYRLTSDCDIPSMPGKGSTRADWDTYAALVRDYNECASQKAAAAGTRAKEALEGVGETVTGLSDKAAGWFKK